MLNDMRIDILARGKVVQKFVRQAMEYDPSIDQDLDTYQEKFKNKESESITKNRVTRRVDNMVKEVINSNVEKEKSHSPELTERRSRLRGEVLVSAQVNSITGGHGQLVRALEAQQDMMDRGDFISLNKVSVFDDKLMRINKIRNHVEKVMKNQSHTQAGLNKDELEEIKRKRAYFMQHRWEILRDLRQVAIEKALEFRRNFKRVKMWFRLMQLVTVSRIDLRKSCHKIKRHIKTENLKIWAVNTLQIRQKYFVGKIGKTIDDRIKK